MKEARQSSTYFLVLSMIFPTNRIPPLLIVLMLTGCITKADDEHAAALKAKIAQDEPKLRAGMALLFAEVLRKATDDFVVEKIRYHDAKIDDPVFLTKPVTSEVYAYYCIRVDNDTEKNVISYLVTRATNTGHVAVPVTVSINDRTNTLKLSYSIPFQQGTKHYDICTLKNPKPFDELEAKLPSITVKDYNVDPNTKDPVSR